MSVFQARDAQRAAILTVVAGIADAVGYITMGGVFAANMTGNTVLAGMALSQHRYVDAWHHLAPLFSFFVGAALSRFLLRLFRSPTAAFLLEASLLGAIGLLPIRAEAAVLVVAVAMGVQASAVTHFSGSAISTVVVTSTLARTADAALDALWPDRLKHTSAVNPRLLALTWIGYLAGAMTGALLPAVVPYPLLVPAALLLLLLLL